MFILYICYVSYEIIMWNVKNVYGKGELVVK